MIVGQQGIQIGWINTIVRPIMNSTSAAEYKIVGFSAMSFVIFSHWAFFRTIDSPPTTIVTPMIFPSRMDSGVRISMGI